MINCFPSLKRYFRGEVHYLAQAYIKGENLHPRTDQITAFRDWIDLEFENISHTVRFTNKNITLAECKRKFNQTKILNISSTNSIHPILSIRDNLKFRAIHDYSHIKLNCDDSFAGEYLTFLNCYAPQSIHWILFSEIILQAAVTISTGNFPAQKIVKFWGAE